MEVPPFAATPEILSRALNGTPVETLPGGFALVTPPLSAPLVIATDARNRWTFSRASFLYTPRKSRYGDGLHLNVLLHYEDADRDRASQIGRLAARLLRLHRQRFGTEAPFPRMRDTADIWLSRERPMGAGGVHLGGETWANQVYIYSVEVERTSLEWTRTLCHEWGHLTLVAARNYREPEGDAGGFLGERLYLKWLYEEQPTLKTPAEDGVQQADLETYYQRQIAPLLKRFAAGGPLSKVLDGNRTENMDYYIAAALAFENAVGSELLGKALYSINDVAPRDLIRAMVATVDREETFTVRLPAWVPLPRMAYQITADESGQVALADRPPIALKAGVPYRLNLKLAGWKQIRGVSGGITRLTLHRL